MGTMNIYDLWTWDHDRWTYPDCPWTVVKTGGRFAIEGPGLDGPHGQYLSWEDACWRATTLKVLGDRFGLGVDRVLGASDTLYPDDGSKWHHETWEERDARWADAERRSQVHITPGQLAELKRTLGRD